MRPRAVLRGAGHPHAISVLFLMPLRGPGSCFGVWSRPQHGTLDFRRNSRGPPALKGGQVRRGSRSSIARLDKSRARWPQSISAFGAEGPGARRQGGLKGEEPQMPAPPRKRHLGAEQRRALQLLASSPFGASEVMMFANGFTRQMLARLIHTGLATTQRGTPTLAVSRSVASGLLTPVDGRSKVDERKQSSHQFARWAGLRWRNSVSHAAPSPAALLQRWPSSACPIAQLLGFLT